MKSAIFSIFQVKKAYFQPICGKIEIFIFQAQALVFDHTEAAKMQKKNRAHILNKIFHF